jgi:glycerol transport system ATP-binding protein
LFGGNTATLHEGRITQFGPTSAIYRRPNTLLSAQVFSDPPINVAKVTKRGDEIVLGEGVSWRAGRSAQGVPDGSYTIGIRPHHITPTARNQGAAALEGRVLVAELSGSESILHLNMNGQTWVSQSHGIHPFPVGSTAKLYVDVDQTFFFDADNKLIAGAA